MDTNDSKDKTSKEEEKEVKGFYLIYLNFKLFLFSFGRGGNSRLKKLQFGAVFRKIEASRY